ncbi:unnamed protein product, partial [Arabidopsis halleri]
LQILFNVGAITIIQRRSYKTRFNSGVMRFTNPHSHARIILSFIRIQIKRPRTLSPPPSLKLKKVCSWIRVCSPWQLVHYHYSVSKYRDPSRISHMLQIKISRVPFSDLSQ